MNGAHSLSEIKEGKSVTEENPEWARQRGRGGDFKYYHKVEHLVGITGEQNPADKLLCISMCQALLEIRYQ